MRKAATAFRAQGTTDEMATKGTEFWRRLTYYKKKALLGFTVLFFFFLLNFGFRAFANPLFMLDLRSDVYHAFMEKDVEYYDNNETGILVGRLSQDVTMIHEIFIDKVLNVLMNLAQSVGGMILALVVCWRAALPCIGVVILCGIVYVVGDKIVDQIWVEYNESSSAACSKAEEAITSFRTIKSFNNEEYEAHLYKKTLKDVDRVFDKTSLAQAVKDAIIFFLMHLMQVMLIYYGCYLVIREPYLGYQSGDILVCLMSMTFATMGVSTALSLSDDFMKASVSAAKLLEIIETPPKVDRKEGGTMDTVHGKIEFRDVSFKYPGTNQWAVEHLSFVINAGETVALVGESGCGKSTTLQLLQRFYEVTSGEILIDDVNISTLSSVFLRSQIAVVPQSPVLFTMSIEDNIKYSKNHATDEEVAHAAQIGNAHSFIMELPDNYKTRVQSTSLSGGQKQRICISRAILANAPILLLDEATAALDTESEQLVQQSLENFRHGKTAILVAHRLATVINSDRILVFANGHVAEEGTHSELLQRDGIYSDLVKYQLQ